MNFRVLKSTIFVIGFLLHLSLGAVEMQPHFTSEEVRQLVDSVAIGIVEKVESSDKTFATGEKIRIVTIVLRILAREKGNFGDKVTMSAHETIQIGRAPGGHGVPGLTKIRTGDKIRAYFYDPKEEEPKYILAAFEEL